MNYNELYKKVQSGEIKLPVIVKINTPIWDDFELDASCKAKLISIISEDDSFHLYFDFSEFEEYNKSFWERNYYDSYGKPTEAIYEQKFYKSLNCKCDCFPESVEDEIRFEILNQNEIITFESKIIDIDSYTLDCGVYLPDNNYHLVGKKVKVTIEVLEDK